MESYKAGEDENKEGSVMKCDKCKKEGSWCGMRRVYLCFTHHIVEHRKPTEQIIKETPDNMVEDMEIHLTVLFKTGLGGIEYGKRI